MIFRIQREPETPEQRVESIHRTMLDSHGLHQEELVENCHLCGNVAFLLDELGRVKKLRAGTPANVSQGVSAMSARYLDFVFTGPPDHTMPQLIEVEDEQGKSVQVGTWLQREDKAWVLRLPLNEGGTSVE